MIRFNTVFETFTSNASQGWSLKEVSPSRVDNAREFRQRMCCNDVNVLERNSTFPIACSGGVSGFSLKIYNCSLAIAGETISIAQ